MTTDQEYRDRATALANMFTARPERHYQGAFILRAVENECGTTACAAGWAKLAADGVVSIALNGEMTWAEQLRTVDYHAVITDAPQDGAAWLGLGYDAAHALFFRTTDAGSDEAANRLAVDVLRQLGAGTLPRDGVGVDDYITTELED